MSKRKIGDNDNNVIKKKKYSFSKSTFLKNKVKVHDSSL